MKPRTHVYIDGFNMYYGSVKGTPYKWLNLLKLCQLLLPEHDIRRVWYFTAMVGARPEEPQQPLRQQAYLRALRTVPEIRVELGQFAKHNRVMPLVQPIQLPDRVISRVRVVRTDEKGSDVNLATRLLHEAHLDLYDVGVVISNDSDLLAPIKLVRGELGKKIGVINPHPQPSREMINNADFTKQLRRGPISASMFPMVLRDSKGVITCPTAWQSRQVD